MKKSTPAGGLRLEPNVRKQIINAAILKVAVRDGLAALTFNAVGAECEVPTSRATLKRYVKTQSCMRDIAVATASGAVRARLRAERDRLQP